MIAIWLLWEAAQEYPGPMLPLINISAFFLIYPMAVVALYPIADYFIKPKNGWLIVLIVTTLAMFTNFLAGYGEDVIPVMTDAPPTYLDNLIKGATGILNYMTYGMIFYIIIILIAKIFKFKKKSG
ncbi:hypothetical protein [Methanooceanicella nereidis]|uniref:hypothetical protein n=1 Tax=Methanooceanicella nereidis TaxID=2052831 RepID=UPI001E53F774|nr:hypothetical protein [Methanocella sp. CWC-04]